MSQSAKIVTTTALVLGRHPRRRDHPAIMNADGKLVATFGANETREEIAAAIEAAGYTVNNDNSILESTVAGLPQETARDGPCGRGKPQEKQMTKAALAKTTAQKPDKRKPATNLWGQGRTISPVMAGLRNASKALREQSEQVYDLVETTATCPSMDELDQAYDHAGHLATFLRMLAGELEESQADIEGEKARRIAAAETRKRAKVVVRVGGEG